MATILIIDDEDPIRTMLTTMLERAGHTVLEAQNGKLGQAILGRQAVDLVITDILMPEQDGLEFIRDIKRSYPSVKVIAISGGGRTGKLDFLSVAREFGAHSILRKPFDRKELLSIIQSLHQGT